MIISSIIFSAPMIRAILDGRKTQARRVVWPHPNIKIDNDLLVREAWQTLPEYDHLPPREIPEGADIIYTADRPHCPWDSRKRNALHMPRWASRITLRITDVWVERIQEISEEDARAEGVLDGGCLNCGESEPCGCESPQPDARDGFIGMWHDIYTNHPVKSWDANPLVWVIEFERIKP